MTNDRGRDEHTMRYLISSIHNSIIYGRNGWPRVSWFGTPWHVSTYSRIGSLVIYRLYHYRRSNLNPHSSQTNTISFRYLFVICLPMLSSSGTLYNRQRSTTVYNWISILEVAFPWRFLTHERAKSYVIDRKRSEDENRLIVEIFLSPVVFAKRGRSDETSRKALKRIFRMES
jgi:hypothetical protein